MDMDAHEALDGIFQFARASNASDIHMKVGVPPVVRTPSGLDVVSENIWTREHIDGLVQALLTRELDPEAFERDGEIDLGYVSPSGGRARINIYHSMGEPNLAIRLIADTPPELSQLQFNESLEKCARYTDGLVIMAGPTGSGKTTTQAALLARINNTRSAHVITIEDPIEYRFVSNECMFTQREIGSDCLSFARGLRAALRQDPDVIVVGECRDRESMEIALQAAETGHVVYTTLHTISVRETISRVLEMFPAEAERHVRAVLASVLKAVVVQRMLPGKAGGRIVAQEIAFNTERIKDYINQESNEFDIDDIIEDGTSLHGMQSLNKNLCDLVAADQITIETAMAYSPQPQNLRLRIQEALQNYRL